MPPPNELRALYLNLQATIEGQASHAHVHEIIAGLRRRNWHVRLFQPAYASQRTAPHPARRLLEFLVVQARMLGSLRSADVIYIRWHFATIFIALAANLAGRPVVQEVNGNYEDVYAAWPSARRLRPVLVLLQRWQLRMASAIVSVTPQLAAWVASEARHCRVAVIPNAANAELFRPDAGAEVDLPHPYVAFVGAFAPWQGLPTLLAAVEHPAWPADVHLIMVGGGPGEASVKVAAQQSRLLSYIGRVPYGHVPGILAGALAALSPKAGDSGVLATGANPLKLYEAMAAGVAIIASNQAGQADVIRSTGAGLIVEPDEPGQLAEAVAWLWSHPEDRAAMGNAGRRAVEANHTWDHRASATDALCRTLIEPDGTP